MSRDATRNTSSPWNRSGGSSPRSSCVARRVRGGRGEAGLVFSGHLDNEALLDFTRRLAASDRLRPHLGALGSASRALRRTRRCRTGASGRAERRAELRGRIERRRVSDVLASDYGPYSASISRFKSRSSVTWSTAASRKPAIRPTTSRTWRRLIRFRSAGSARRPLRSIG